MLARKCNDCVEECTQAIKAFAEKAAIALADNYSAEYTHWIDDTLYALVKEMTEGNKK